MYIYVSIAMTNMFNDDFERMANEACSFWWGRIGHKSLDNIMAADVLAHYIAGE